MALLALRSNANQLLSFNIRDDENLPSTALPVFRSPEHAMEFRDSVLKLADTRSFLWTVSLCRKTREATFESRISRFYRRNKASTYEYSMIWPDVRPKKFDVNDSWLIDEMIYRKIGCFAIESYHLNLDLNKLVVDGTIWLPNLNTDDII